MMLRGRSGRVLHSPTEGGLFELIGQPLPLEQLALYDIDVLDNPCTTFLLVIIKYLHNLL